MKISFTTIDKLAEIISGGAWGIGVAGSQRLSMKLPYRSGPQLVDFFNDFGADDIYGSGFPSRVSYTKDKIVGYNGTNKLKDIIELAVDPDYLDNNGCPANEVVINFNKYLVKDGYKLVEDHRFVRMVGNSPEKLGMYYRIQELTQGAGVDIKELSQLTHPFIREQIDKARDKISKADYDGAITNARSLVEAVQENILRKVGEIVPDYDGNLVTLYKATKKALNLDPSNKNLSELLKQILGGLNSLITGLAGLSNKTADRHSRQYRPKKHHAKLAVNVSLTFCEFLLETYEYQYMEKVE